MELKITLNNFCGLNRQIEHKDKTIVAQPNGWGKTSFANALLWLQGEKTSPEFVNINGDKQFSVELIENNASYKKEYSGEKIKYYVDGVDVIPQLWKGVDNKKFINIKDDNIFDNLYQFICDDSNKTKEKEKNKKALSTKQKIFDSIVTTINNVNALNMCENCIKSLMQKSDSMFLEIKDIKTKLENIEEEIKNGVIKCFSKIKTKDVIIIDKKPYFILKKNDADYPYNKLSKSEKICLHLQLLNKIDTPKKIIAVIDNGECLDQEKIKGILDLEIDIILFKVL